MLIVRWAGRPSMLVPMRRGLLFQVQACREDRMKRYGIVFAALVAGDALTTAYGLIVAGAVELNPLGPVAALAAKSIVTMLALALLHWQEPRYRFASAVPFSIALTVPVAFNLAALTGVIG